MFSGEKVLEDLRCDNSLMKTMVDRFGEDVTDQYQTGRSAYLRLEQLLQHGQPENGESDQSIAKGTVTVGDLSVDTECVECVD